MTPERLSMGHGIDFRVSRGRKLGVAAARTLIPKRLKDENKGRMTGAQEISRKFGSAQGLMTGKCIHFEASSAGTLRAQRHGKPIDSGVKREAD